MYSTNGRVRKNKETAKEEKAHMVLFCEECGHIMADKKKEFGESRNCDRCGSSNLTYKYE